MRTIDEVLRGLKNYRSEGQFRLSASNAVEAALSALPGRAMPQVREFIATERAVSVSFVCANNTAEVAVGDVVQAGILLHYSAGPDEGMSVRALYLRLKCLNGLVAEECGAPARILSHPHDSHLGSIEATVGGLWARLPRKLEELRALPRNRAAVPSLLEESARRAGLSRQHTMPRLLRAWAEEESASVARRHSLPVRRHPVSRTHLPITT